MKELKHPSEPLSCPIGFLVVIPFELENDYRELSDMKCRLNSKDAILLGPSRFVNHKRQPNCDISWATAVAELRNCSYECKRMH